MVPASSTASRPVTPQPAPSLHLCYARLFGRPDAIAVAELDAIAQYLPSHPSPELVLLVAVSVHHRMDERTACETVANHQAHLQAQVSTLAATVVQMERIRELRMGLLRLLAATLMMAGSVYLAIGAIQTRGSLIVAILQCAVAFMVSAATVALLWRPR